MINQSTKSEKNKACWLLTLLLHLKPSGCNKPMIKYAVTVKTQIGRIRIGMNSQKTFDKKYVETR